jgi:putative membrane protein (TIGR04086 family)
MKIGAKKLSIAISYGLITIFILAAITSLVISLLLKFTQLQELSLSWIMLTISFIILFIGGFVSGGKGKEKGWLLGGGTGLCYSLIIFLLQYLGFEAHFTLEQMLYHLGFLVISILGGILGVNMTSQIRKQN